VNASLVFGNTDLAAAAIHRARSRIKATPGSNVTLDDLGDETLQPLLLEAFQRASLELLAGRSPLEWLGPGREQLLDRLTNAMLDELRQPSGLDSREVDHVTFRLDRHSVDQLTGQLWRCRTAHIQNALERADYEDAAFRALVCAATTIPLPAQMTADVLVGVEQARVFVALGRQVLPTDTEPLYDLIRRARFPATIVGTEQTALTLFLLWKLERPKAKMLLPHLRSLIRTRSISTRAAGWALWLARQLGDSSVDDIFTARRGLMGDVLVNIIGGVLPDAWATPMEDVIASLPLRISDAGLDHIPARAAPRSGRNEPCPCASGKKYKRCCADKPAVIAPNTARARVERLQEASPRLERYQIARLSRVDLALLEFSRLRDLAVFHLMRNYVVLRDWTRAALALDELTRRHGDAFSATHVEYIVLEALMVRQYDVAEKLLPRLQDPAARAATRLEIDLATRIPEALPKLEAAALAALKDENDQRDLAFITLRTTPAIGILIARGMLQDGGTLERETLLEAIEDARDVLLLPPGDPVTAQLQALDVEREAQVPEPGRSDSEATRTAAPQAALDNTSERLLALQRQLDERERDLARAERAAQEQSQRAHLGASNARPAPAAQAATDLRDQRALRDKIDALQARIREGNEERARLRRQLSDAVAGDLGGSGPTPMVASYGSDPMEDDTEAIPFAPSSRALLFPEFTDSAKASLVSVPRSIASLAMRTVAGLAAGDPAAWRNIKQAKDMRRQVLMARLGIHHRLLFRVESTVLDVLDVSTRENLDINLKRMRSG
jgi:hypothetical protein